MMDVLTKIFKVLLQDMPRLWQK